MVREILKIYTDEGKKDKNPSFKGIEITEYSYSSTRMGMPQMTATLMWHECLDNEWTGKEYVTFRGERYYIRHTPSSSKSNTDARYKHELVFHSERDELLANVYFVDAVYNGALTHDKPCSNSTTVIFYGNIKEFCDRLNCALRYAGVGDSALEDKTDLTTLDTVNEDGYCVMLDPYGDYDKEVSKEFSFSDQYLWDVISQGYESFEVPFEMRGKKIIFGAVPQKVNHKFKYGHDNSLLSVSKNNANAKVINRITMLGSSENIPYSYPNETEYGHVNLMVDPGNNILKDPTSIEIQNMSQLVSNLREQSFAELKAYKEVSSAKVNLSSTLKYSFDQIKWTDFNIGGVVKHPNQGRQHKTLPVYIQLSFNVSTSSEFRLSEIKGNIWEQDSSIPALPESLLSGIKPVSLKPQGGTLEIVNNIKIAENGIDFGYLDSGGWSFIFAIDVKNAGGGLFTPIVSYIGITSITIHDTIVTERSGFYWDVDGKRMRTGELGLKLPADISNAMVGDKIAWYASDRINTQDRLMPPKYRETKGAQRFYNAVNGIYADPDTNQMYIFPNPYVDGAPNEYIYKNEDIKPTLEGIKNSEDKLMGSIVDIAYDSDDNDSLKSEDSEDTDKNNALKYAHSYFYIRLNIFNGAYGFNLFKHASQTDPMTIQMTSGPCDGCKFKVQAVEFTDDNGMNYYKNPVQTDPNTGYIVPGSYKDKVKEDEFDDSQQDTTTHSIWLCVQKDAETFGVIMPNREHNYRPKIGDTFNIINIDLPEVYIKAAEKRLEQEGIRFMLDNNEEKFTFDISASRIFFANNPKVLAQLDEYSLIDVEYNGKTYEQYVSSFNVNCKNGEALPEIQVGLTDTLAVGESFVQNVAERALSMVANPETMGAGGGGVPTRLLDKRYLRKDQDDRTPYKVASNLGFEVGRYTSGSSGGIFYQDPDTGRVYLEVDELRVRMKAIFEELMISKVTSIAGKQVITPGGSIDITYVEDIAANPGTQSVGAYRCYYKAKEDDKGGKCMFIVGDQVQCREFNIGSGTTTNASNRFYWRKVIAVSEEGSYVDLSKDDCAPNSDAPQIGDTICQLGSREDKTRQSAIIFSTVDNFAPCITLYNGIGEGTKIAEWYSMEAKSVIEYGVDKTKTPPEPFFNCYGRMYIGPRTRESYIEFTPSNKKLVFKGELNVQSTISGKDLLTFIQENAGVSEDIEDYINNVLKGFQDQIDGVIETWFWNGVPTLTNYPASDWNTENLKIQHLGDLYYDNDTGTAYRFSQNTDGSFYWNVITDDAITKALAAAAKAQDTADSKRRVFTAQPQAKDVYDPGDLWVNATYGTKYTNDILRCITHKNAGTPFSIDHWMLASKYTDDSGLNAFIVRYEKEIAGYREQLDGKIDTWYFNYNPTVSNKPASDWNDTEKTEHAGDLFYNTATKKVFRWTGSAWESMTDPDIQAALDSASDAQDTADNKRRVFMSQPTTPYDKGDLWIDNGTNGKTLKVCITSRESGNFLASEWVIADDAALNAFATSVENTLNGIVDQLDKKAQTWYQATDPSAAWTTADEKVEHKGDLWHNTTNNTTWFWNGSSWQEMDVPDSVFDAIDGKADIFVSKPTGGYLMNDLWFLEAKYTLSGVEYEAGTLVVAIRDMGSAWSANDWVKKDRYTDDTLAQEAVDRFVKWANDGVFSPTEMRELELEIERIDGDKNKFDQQYSVYDNPGSALTSAKTAYDSAYTVYKASINSVLNATPDKDGCVAVPSDFQSKMQHYYNVRAQYDYNFTLKQKEYSDSVVAQYEYLKNALAQDTTISGGVIISTLASMGYTDSNGVRHTLAGINGQRTTALGDRSIGSWWGGQMIDLFDTNDNRKNPVPSNAATSLVRMDGSAYFANGNIGFRADGSGWLGNDSTGIKFANTGVMTFGSGVTFNVSNVLGLQTTLNSIANFNTGLTNLLRPCDANGNEISWEEGGQLDTDGTYKAKSLKAKVGLWTEFFLSARGKNPNESGGSIGASALADLTDVTLSAPASGQALVYNGSKWVNQAIQTGLDETALASYLTTNNYAKKSDIPSLTPYLKVDGSNGTAAGLTAMINKLLPGDANITDSTMLVTSHATAPDGNNYYRRSATCLWNYIKGKADSVYATSGHTHNVIINGETKTISATGAPAVNLGTFLTSHQSLANYYTKSEVDTKDKRLTTYYASRPASANVNFGNNTGLYTFLATSSMTTGKPANDAHILHMEWDTSLSWAAQMAVPTTGNMQWRAQSGTTWQAWRTLLDSSNYASVLDGRYYTESEINTRLAGYLARSGGSMTNTNVVTNLNADLLDGYNGTDYLRSFWTNNPGYDCSTISNRRSFCSFTYGYNAPFTGGFVDINANGYGFYLGTTYSSDQPLYYRRHGITGDGAIGSWQQLARVTDTVANANSLGGVAASQYARITQPNNFVHAGNEITLIPAGFTYSNKQLWINYRCGADGSNANFNEYVMGNGTKGGTASVRAASFIKSGGTSSQFLKADGSVDSNSYLTTGSASSTYVKKAGDTMTGVLKVDTIDSVNGNGLLCYAPTTWPWVNSSQWGVGTTNLQGVIRSNATNLIHAKNGTMCTIWDSGNDGSGSGLDADLLDGYHLDSVRGYRVYHSSINSALSVGYIPFNAFGMQHGYPVYNDPEFASGNNSVGIYNNAGNGNVTLTRIADSQASANSSGYILQIQTKGAASPTHGGFIIHINSRANAVFMQIFRAKIPSGYTIKAASNNMGNNYSDVWLTANTGTGKWEWYARMVYCGSSGTFSIGGHTYLSGGSTPTASAPITWYLSHCQVWDLTKNNYGAFRAKFADALSTARTIWGQSFNGTGNVSGSLTGVGYIDFNVGSARISVTNSRLCAFTQSSQALGFNAGSLLVSNAWADDSKVPTNGAYIKGVTKIGTDTASYALNTASFICDSWVRTKGTAGWYSETFDGGWHMTDSTWIKNFNSKKVQILGSSSYSALLIASGGGITVTDNSGYPWDKGQGALNVGIANNNYQTPLLLAYRAQHGFPSSGGANRLFALELLNLGTQLHFGFGGARKFGMNSSGVFHAVGGIYSGGYVSARGQNTSDIRLKEDIKDFRATDIIKALRPVQFKWNATARSKFPVLDTDAPQYGLIAQETLMKNPWLVDPNMFHDGFMGVHYNKLIPVLLKGEIEIMDDVESLKRRVNNLERENRELKRKMERIVG